MLTKGSLATSTVLHVLLLGFALASFSAPKTLEVTDVEAFPINIVPIEEITRIQQGEREAPLAQTAAPTPTKRPDPVADAENTGENSVDLKPVETASVSPREVVAEAPPKPAEKPVPAPVARPEPAPRPEPVAEPAPKPEPTPEPVAQPAPEPTPAPTPEPTPAPTPEPTPEPAPAPEEVAALPDQSTPDPVAEAIEQAPAQPEFAALPTAGPVPQARPKPEPARPAPTETATRTETRPSEAASASSKQSDFNADEVAALLNKQDPSGGGAKRSTETAALGGSRTTSGATLSQSEMDALRGQIQKYWSIIPGMADGGDVRVTVKMRLDPSGNIVGQPEVIASGGSDGTRGTLAGSARRAVLQAQPYQLPAEKYDTWSDVIVNFDPSQMF